MSWGVFITHTLLVASMGMAMEVVFVAFTNRKKDGDWRLKGYTYVWMAPIYMSVYPSLSWLYPKVAAYGFWARGLLYVGLIFAGEYASGLILRWSTGECPWEREYRGAKWSVGDLIRIDYAPAWFAAALLFEGAVRALRP